MKDFTSILMNSRCRLVLAVSMSIIFLFLPLASVSASSENKLTVTTELGKGLQESYYPYSSVDIFGQPLGGSGFNYGGDLNNLQIKDPTDTFDLSHFNDPDFTQQSLYHEVVVAVANISYLDGTVDHTISCWLYLL